MSNGAELCCILGICCPPLSGKQSKTLADELIKELDCEPAEANRIAAWVLHKFDLAPAGTLAPFKDAIVQAAKHVKET